MTEIIRPVQPSEVGRLTEIGELTALAYLADGIIDNAHPYVPLLRDARARAEKAHLLMMADGDGGQGPVVGTLTVVPPGSEFCELAEEDEFELRMLAVSPIERGRGIGAKLTRAGMDIATAKGARRIVLSTMDTMHAAHRLYERLGFVRRQDLDSVVVDHSDGSITKLAPEDAAGDADSRARGVTLLGYSWDVSEGH